MEVSLALWPGDHPICLLQTPEVHPGGIPTPIHGLSPPNSDPPKPALCLDSKSFDKQATCRFSLAYQRVIKSSALGEANLSGAALSKLALWMLLAVSSRPGLQVKVLPSDLALAQAVCPAKPENNDSLDAKPRPNNAREIRLPSYLAPSNVRLSTTTSVAMTVPPPP